MAPTRLAWQFLCGLCLVAASAAWAEPLQPSPNAIETPKWFKSSFLDFREDIDEATAANKRVMIYFGQDGCPYCKRLMEVNFRQQDIVDAMQRYFDAIEINIFGSREVTWLDGKARSEKDFSALLGVQFTPTLLFLDEKGGVALRVNGYYAPPRFMAALDYVSQHNENRLSFAEFQERHARQSRDALHAAEPFFREGPYDFAHRPAARPLAIFFEQRDCSECDEMHATALKDEATRKLLSSFDVYRLDLQGDAAVIAPDGTKTTAAHWGRALNVVYAPSIIFLDGGGREIFRVEAYVRAFHLQSALDYVASGAYLKEPNFQRYIQARANAIRAGGGRVELMQ